MYYYFYVNILLCNRCDKFILTNAINYVLSLCLWVFLSVLVILLVINVFFLKTAYLFEML